MNSLWSLRLTKTESLLLGSRYPLGIAYDITKVCSIKQPVSISICVTAKSLLYDFVIDHVV